MDKIVPIIYMLGVFLLILPAFMNSNNNFKTFFHHKNLGKGAAIKTAKNCPNIAIHLILIRLPSSIVFIKF